MSKVRRCLTRLLAKHHCLWVDQTEGINHHLPFDALDWVYHHRHSPLIQSFKTLNVTTEFKDLSNNNNDDDDDDEEFKGRVVSKILKVSGVMT